MLASQALRPNFSSPEAYTPKYLGDKILTSRSALEGERKQVTILFADLKGSMELLADRDPEDARQLLDPILARMMDSVHRFEGTVNQVMGDGIMALFGAPVAHEDHAVRACYAALRMQESVTSYRDEVLRTHGIPLQIRVGLHSGEVVVRSIGSDLRMDYTAVGQTTHLAARMEQLAKPGTVLITAQTFRLAAGTVRVKPLGPVPVKGLGAPIEIYELVAVPAARSRLLAAAAHGLTPFVGREAELDRLREALWRAETGNGQAVGVLGEAGVGKTRLFYEFSRYPREQGWVVLETNAVSYGQSTPYLPVIDLLKAYFNIEDIVERREIRERVTSKLFDLYRDRDSHVTALLALLDVPVDDIGWQTLDPPQRRQRTLNALAGLFLRASHSQPLCLLVESLHWIDSETQTFLDLLVASLPSHRVLLLVNYRPEYQHIWALHGWHTEIAIDPLLPESAEEFLGSIMGLDPSLSPLKQLLIDRTEGNPFFLEETISTLADSDVLAGGPGAYRLAKPIASIQVPATVQAVLASRIDRLPLEEKRLLQCAAVIGKHADLKLLQAISELTEGDLHAALAHLQAAGFLYESRHLPDVEYTFRHALTYEVAYGGLLHDRRRILHALIAEKILALYPDHLTERVERLAHHAFQGELWENAAMYLRQAGTKSFVQSVYRSAAARFEEALIALQQLPPTRQTIERLIDVRLDLRNSLLPVGEVATVLRHLHEAGQLAESLGDRRRGGWVSGYMSACSWALGDYSAALDAARRTLALAKDLGDDQLRIYGNVALAWAHHSLGEYREGVKHSHQVVELLQGPRTRERIGIPSLPAVLARTWLISCLAELGEFTRALALADEGIALAQDVGEPWTLVDAHLGCGILQLRRGDLATATRILEEGIGICRRFSIDVWFTPIASSLGYTYALAGKLEEGTALLKQALDKAAATRLRFYHSLAVIWMGETHLLGNRVDDARKLAAEAFELCHAHREAGNRAYAERLLGDIASHPGVGDVKRADDHYRQALAAATQLGMRPFIAQCHMSRGLLYASTHRFADAKEELSASLTIFNQLGMTQQAERSAGALAHLLP